MYGAPDKRRRQRVLIAGGGVAGLEAALALRDLTGDRLEVQVRDPHEEFVYRPFAVGAPYGAARVVRHSMERIADLSGIEFRLGSIAAVDADERRATTHDGEKVSFDHLVVAPGVRLLWPLPGAVTFWGVEDETGIGEVVHRLRAGELGSVVFTLPSGCGRTWALPLYELALFAATERDRAGGAAKGTRLTVVTPEDGPLQLFGLRASGQMGELLAERGVEVLTGAHPIGFEDGRLRIAPLGEIEADAVVSLPRMEGRRIAGIPHDEEGFVPVDEHGRVRGLEHVYAAGDVTAFPVKQGGISTQQADAAAEQIAADAGIGVSPQPFDPILRGVLWTGEKPRYLYGRLTGGHGETSILSERPLWPAADGKIVGRYLTRFLAALSEGMADPSVDSRPRAGVRQAS